MTLHIYLWYIRVCFEDESSVLIQQSTLAKGQDGQGESLGREGGRGDGSQLWNWRGYCQALCRGWLASELITQNNCSTINPNS